MIESQHSKLGRGGAILRSKIKNLITGSIVEKTFKGGDKFEPVQIERKKAQYLYSEGGEFFFMDQSSFEQFSLDLSVIAGQENYLLEGEIIQIQSYRDHPIALELPIKMDFSVIEAEKGIKGDTATAATKPVKIETGLIVNAPLFIKTGDKIRIDTRTGT